MILLSRLLRTVKDCGLPWFHCPIHWGLGKTVDCHDSTVPSVKDWDRLWTAMIPLSHRLRTGKDCVDCHDSTVPSVEDWERLCGLPWFHCPICWGLGQNVDCHDSTVPSVEDWERLWTAMIPLSHPLRTGKDWLDCHDSTVPLVEDWERLWTAIILLSHPLRTGKDCGLPWFHCPIHWGLGKTVDCHDSTT